MLSAVRKLSSDGKHSLVLEVSAAQAVLLVIIGGLLVRLALAATVGLGVDESYTVGISRNLDWSYFDHPPLHLWIVGLWAKLFGESPLALRIPFIGLFAASTWLMYRLTARAYGERAGLWAVIAFSLAPVFTLSIGSWVLPDGPMVLFLLLAAVFVQRALQAEDGRAAWLWWLAAGAAAGLAMLSKYLAVFFFVGVALYLLSSPDRRHWLGRPQPWAGAALALLLFAPVVVWNVGNDFASFSFQGGRGRPQSFDKNWLIQGVAGQFLYLLPWIAVPLLVALFRASPISRPADRLFLLLSVPAIALFFALAFVTRILPHWPMAGWLFAFPMLGRDLAALSPPQARLLKQVAIATLIVLLGFFVVAGTQARYGWAAAYFRDHKDPTVDLYDWTALNAALEERNLVPPGGFIATGQWIEGGKINYALGGRVPVLCLCDDPRGFVYDSNSDDYINSDAVLLARNAGRIEAMAIYFSKIERLPDIVLMRAGQAAVTLKVARGIRLKDAP